MVVDDDDDEDMEDSFDSKLYEKSSDSSGKRKKTVQKNFLSMDLEDLQEWVESASDD